MEMFQEKLKKIQQALRRRGIDFLFVADRYNIAYISGFTGSYSYIIVSSQEAFFFTDDRYLQRAKKELGGIFNIIRLGRKPWERLKDFLQPVKGGIIGFETNLTFDDYQRLAEICKDKKCKLQKSDSIIKQMRMTKDEAEIALIKKSAELTDKVFEGVLNYLKVGRTEREICRQIKLLALELGAEELAFPPIVASGVGSAIPHYEPGDKKLEVGEMVIIDLGVKWQGYCSDMTRTIIMGRASRQVKRLYNTVLSGQKIGLTELECGIKAKDLDAKVRKFFRKSGFARGFLHGLGHSLGLEIHEPPGLNSQSAVRIKPGMILTIEPGLYINGFGGIRIEDTVLVEDNRVEILTKSTKELMEI